MKDLAVVSRFLKRKHDRNNSSDLVAGLGGNRSISTVTLNAKSSKSSSFDTLLGTPPPVLVKDVPSASKPPHEPSQNHDQQDLCRDGVMNTATQFALAHSAVQSLNGTTKSSTPLTQSTIPSRFTSSPSAVLLKPIQTIPPPILAELPGSLLLENEGFSKPPSDIKRVKRVPSRLVNGVASRKLISQPNLRQGSQDGVASHSTARTLTCEALSIEHPPKDAKPSKTAHGALESKSNSQSEIEIRQVTTATPDNHKLNGEEKQSGPAPLTFDEKLQDTSSSQQRGPPESNVKHGRALAATRAAKHFPIGHEHPGPRMRSRRSCPDLSTILRQGAQKCQGTAPGLDLFSLSIPLMPSALSPPRRIAPKKISQGSQTTSDPYVEQLEDRVRMAELKAEALQQTQRLSRIELENLKADIRMVECDKQDLQEKLRLSARENDVVRANLSQRDTQIELLNKKLFNSKDDVNMLEDKIQMFIREVNRLADSDNLLKELQRAHEDVQRDVAKREETIQRLQTALGSRGRTTPQPDAKAAEDDTSSRIESLQSEIAKHLEDIRLYKLDVRGYKKDVKRRDQVIMELENTIMHLRPELSPQGRPGIDATMHFDVPLGLDLRGTNAFGLTPPMSTPSSSHRSYTPSPLMSRFHPGYPHSDNGLKGSGVSSPLSPTMNSIGSPLSASNSFFPSHTISSRPSVSSLATRDGGQSVMSIRDGGRSAMSVRDGGHSALSMRDGSQSAMSMRDGSQSSLGMRVASPVSMSRRDIGPPPVSKDDSYSVAGRRAKAALRGTTT
ncbi:MAG: hypothetical protein M1825_005284 [Sarcosagium campestre]|nr:MAG: hypothetical protein M1825_005284 [Sarcosagium campestre]